MSDCYTIGLFVVIGTLLLGISVSFFVQLTFVVREIIPYIDKTSQKIMESEIDQSDTWLHRGTKCTKGASSWASPNSSQTRT
jgi:ABC-type sulfate transport system permease subunit